MTAVILILAAPLLFGSGLAAPRSEDRLEDPGNALNPFTSGPEQLSLLQGYLQDEDPVEEKISDMKRESVILHLFVLNDFDKSGFMDGLELMRLVRRILAKDLQKEPAEDSVVFLVDDILMTQDLNQDGLLSAQELVTPPMSKPEDSAPVNVAIPIPPGAHPGSPASENEVNVPGDTTEASEAAHREAEPTANVEDEKHEPAPTPAEAETAQEEPALTDGEAASVEKLSESEEVEEPAEDNEDKQVVGEEVIAGNEM